MPLPPLIHPAFKPLPRDHILRRGFACLDPTCKRVMIRCMDFWKVVDDRITDDWVMVDFPHVMAQLGIDCPNGYGLESFDSGELPLRRPPAAPTP